MGSVATSISMDMNIRLLTDTELKDSMHSPHFGYELGTQPIAIFLLEQGNCTLFVDKARRVGICIGTLYTGYELIEPSLRGTNVKGSDKAGMKICVTQEMRTSNLFMK
jgi:hypothetical protein